MGGIFWLLGYIAFFGVIVGCLLVTRTTKHPSESERKFLCWVPFYAFLVASACLVKSVTYQ